MSSPPDKPTNSTTRQGPAFKEQARSDPNQTTSGPDFKDQFREANRPPRPATNQSALAANERPPTVLWAKAVPVNDSVVQRERRQIELDERVQMVERLEMQQQQQQSSGPGITKKQWLIAGLVILVVIAATSVAITAFSTGNSRSPSSPTSSTDPATDSGPVMPSTTNIPIMSPTSSLAPVVSHTDALMSPTGRPVVSPTSLLTKAPSNADRATAILNVLNSINLTSLVLSYPSQATPGERAAQWLINEDLTTDPLDTLAIRQRFALATMWFASGPFDSDHTDTWLSSTGECEWWSVDTCVDGEVTSLHLFNDILSGSIPADVGLLTALTLLNLQINQLSVTIPTQLGTLTALTWLSLAGNQLSGTIPTQILSLTSLTRFQVWSNDLTGSMPFCDGDSSRFIDLWADCQEVDCPCCTDCCTDGSGCVNN